jgi:hypothetical protein
MMLPLFVVETGAGIAESMVVLATSGFTTTCPYGFEFVGVGFGLVMFNRCIAICNITIFFKKAFKIVALTLLLYYHK